MNTGEAINRLKKNGFSVHERGGGFLLFYPNFSSAGWKYSARELISFAGCRINQRNWKPRTSGDKSYWLLGDCREGWRLDKRASKRRMRRSGKILFDDDE
jgi:hypothetical protein